MVAHRTLSGRRAQKVRDGLRRACDACAGREGIVRTKAVLRSRVFGCGSYGGYVCVIFLEVLALLVCSGQAKFPSQFVIVLFLFSGLLFRFCGVSPRQARLWRVALCWLRPVLLQVCVSGSLAGPRGRPGGLPSVFLVVFAASVVLVKLVFVACVDLAEFGLLAVLRHFPCCVVSTWWRDLWRVVWDTCRK